jgi:hypothetical protein
VRHLHRRQRRHAALRYLGDLLARAAHDFQDWAFYWQISFFFLSSSSSFFLLLLSSSFFFLLLSSSSSSFFSVF